MPRFVASFFTLFIGLIPVVAEPQVRVRYPRTDAFGDALPKGAVARLGTLRWKGSERMMATAFSADGKFFAAACGDDRLRIWEHPSGILLRSFQLNNAEITGSIAFSADQKYVLFGAQNSRAPRSVELATGKLSGYDMSTELASAGQTWITANGRWAVNLLSEGERGRLTLFDWTRPNQRKVIGLIPATGQNAPPFAAISPDGRWVAVSYIDAGGLIVGRVICIDTTTGKFRETPTYGLQNPMAPRLAFTPDSKSLIVGHESLLVTWSIKPGSANAAPELTQGPRFQQAWRDDFITVLMATPDGKTAIAGNSGGAIAIWNLANGKIERSWLVAASNGIAALALTPDSKTLAVTTELDVSVRLFELPAGLELLTRTGHKAAIHDIVFHPSGKALATASGDDGTVRTWDVTPRKVPLFAAKDSPVEERIRGIEHAQLGGKGQLPGELAFAAEGRFLVVGERGRGITIWDTTKTGKPRELSIGLDWKFMSVSPDGETIAIALPQTGLQVLDAGTGETRKHQPGVVEAIDKVDFSADSKHLLIATSDGSLMMWDLLTGREVKPKGMPNKGIANRFFTSCNVNDHIAYVWDRLNGRMVRRLEGVLQDGSLSRDGRYLASPNGVSIDLRETATGKIVQNWTTSQQVRVVRFSPDGSLLAAGYADGTVLLWNAKPPGAGTARFDKQRLDALWHDLGNPEPNKAFAAIGALLDSPKNAIELLRDRLKIEPSIDKVLFTRWLAELEDPSYAVREKATKRLEKIASRIEDSLELALVRSGTESERRLERVLKSIRQPLAAGEELRILRCTELLERLGTPDSQVILGKLASTQGPSARDARDALERLRSR